MTKAITKHVIPVGTTEPQDFSLRDDGEAFDGSGLTVTLEISQYVAGEFADVDTPPTVAWLDQDAGTVRVSDVGTLEVGNYFVRFRVSSGPNVGFFPNGEKSDLWQVVDLAAR